MHDPDDVLPFSVKYGYRVKPNCRAAFFRLADAHRRGERRHILARDHEGSHRLLLKGEVPLEDLPLGRAVRAFAPAPQRDPLQGAMGQLPFFAKSPAAHDRDETLGQSMRQNDERREKPVDPERELLEETGRSSSQPASQGAGE